MGVSGLPPRVNSLIDGRGIWAWTSLLKVNRRLPAPIGYGCFNLR